MTRNIISIKYERQTLFDLNNMFYLNSDKYMGIKNRHYSETC